MKKLFLIALFAVALIACKKEADYIGTKTMLVASSIVEVQNPHQSEIGDWGECYFIKTDDIPIWHRLNIYRLEGFEHKNGYESLIIVGLYRNFPDNKPIMDMPAYRYKLKRIISQVQKDSEDLPPLEINHEHGDYTGE